MGILKYYFLYIFLIPHYLFYLFAPSKIKFLIDADVKEMNRRMGYNCSLTYYIAMFKTYRNVFYYRLGNKSVFLKWYMRPDNSFYLYVDELGPGIFVLNHPFSTILNAKKIGSNFTFRNLTTLGNKRDSCPDERPTIGNNVCLGANVTIIGDIKIGDNVIVGAGSVIINDIPDNAIVAGVPGRVIRIVEK